MARQIGLLTLWSVLLVLPAVFRGTTIVTWTYEEGAARIWSGADPYAPPEKGDVFLYSPTFAVLYQAIGLLPPVAEAFLWVLVNALVFWAGYGAWFRLGRDSPWWLWAATVLASMELDGPLRYQQMNPLLAGLILLGVAAFRDAKARASALWLGAGANFKVLPLFIAGGLMIPPRGRFPAYFAVAYLGFLLLPAPVTGLGDAFALHLKQFAFLGSEYSARELLDLKVTLARFGLPLLGNVLWGAVALGTVALYLVSRPRPGNDFPFGPWLSLGLLALLLLSPRTESPTYVLLAPVYGFLLAETGRRGRTLVLAAAFLVTLLYNSLWPAALRFGLTVDFRSKPVGALILWILAAWLLLRARPSRA